MSRESLQEHGSSICLEARAVKRTLALEKHSFRSRHNTTHQLRHLVAGALLRKKALGARGSHEPTAYTTRPTPVPNQEARHGCRGGHPIGQTRTRNLEASSPLGNTTACLHRLDRLRRCPPHPLVTQRASLIHFNQVRQDVTLRHAASMPNPDLHAAHLLHQPTTA